MGMNRKVLIVVAGGHGEVSAEKGDYDKVAQAIRNYVERMTDEETRYIVFTVDSVEQAEKENEHGDLHAIIFLTSGLLVKARQMKARFRSYRFRTRVIVLTALLPGWDVIVLGKHWVGDGRNIIQSVLQ